MKLYIKSIPTNQILVTFSKVVDNGETALLTISEEEISSTPNVLFIWNTDSLENGGFLFAPFASGTRAIAISHGKKNGVVGCDTEAEKIKKIFFSFERIAQNHFYIKSDGKYLNVDENGYILLSTEQHMWSL
ncbi:hypothetical protein [Brucella pseudogrignonensis]|uniref:hypothetical protein n=1 Tax=Brucella pseudogrignonensis TaxID=419475 RepID=UPI003D961119